jgi:plastocyanin
LGREASNRRGAARIAIALAAAASLTAPASLAAQTAAPESAAPPPAAEAGSQDYGPVTADSDAGDYAAAPRSGGRSDRATSSASRSVSIIDFAFQPASITVSTGDTVRWVNDGDVPEGHDVTGGELDSGLLESGESYSHTFASAGTVSYICSIHPAMKGTVKVLARSGGGGGGSSSGSSGSAAGGSAGGEEASASAASGLQQDETTDASSDSGSLPSTGAALLPLCVAGLALLGLGGALRLRARRAA